ncbi:MAG: glutamine synthetase type III [Bacteroidetes bacterium HGW-Bacteroidetes-17]|nr:MAG: glutamine synthetase type III [Bacteroidetes bacterium HGW-Bacteroidetes-17]
MNNLRFKALDFINTRSAKKSTPPTGKLSEYYGTLTFNKRAMREFLPVDAFANIINAIESNEKIDRKMADQIAASMKAWAISHGASHYTHWFHPLTGSTAEKHDSFMHPIEEGRAIERFNGSELIQQEPDASSFPSGGIRSTFEARGYTAWDPSSPAFIIDDTLCIPTIFVSYTGEALDFKTPLLKSLNVIGKSAVEFCRLFGNEVKKVTPTLGIEQEYFLVDSALHAARPDLALTGRTVFGHASAKDQQLSDHYFGTIQERALEFMKDVEIESYKLGIPLKTRHNEVAPNQFECAPVFEEVNLAVDHNQMLMHLMQRIARHHDLVVLLHEKPFAGVNGSGKHNNWSMMTDTGENLLSPGKTPKAKLRFIAFFVTVLKAISNNPDLLRASIAAAGNDHRLGGHEAPPAIISAFIGEQLSKTLDEIEETGGITKAATFDNNIFIPKIPEIFLDNTDRNRTSPFAFTGNKFEFRAVGSSATCAKPMIVLNLMVADQLIKFKDEVDILIKKKFKRNDAILKVIRQYIIDSKKIRFEGNNYSDEWIKEAKKRGLANITSTPPALKAYITKETIDLFERNNILTAKELEARYQINLENYTKKIQIESRVMGDLAKNHIIPIAIRYQNTLIENTLGLKQVLDEKTYVGLSRNQIQTIKDISEHISQVKMKTDEMLEERKIANRIEDGELKAKAYNEKVVPYFEEIRRHVDKLELLVDDELWPLPKYRELLFLR